MIDRIEDLIREYKAAMILAASRKEVRDQIGIKVKEAESEAERAKAEIERIMLEANETDDVARVTVSGARVELANKAPSLQVIDESLVPDEWFVTTRSLDKRRMLAKIKAGEEIPGATLSNGGKVVKISLD